MVKILVFLGNPTREYAITRHNVGWMVADYLYPDLAWKEKHKGLFAQTESLKLLKPLTYMNESGRSVRAACDFYHVAVDELLVVHDDLELDFGTIRLQRGGGLQGHNGLKSLKQHLYSDQFIRLRIGIGRPKHGSVASFVLQRFTKEEEIALPLLFNLIKDMLLDCNSNLPATKTLV